MSAPLRLGRLSIRNYFPLSNDMASDREPRDRVVAVGQYRLQLAPLPGHTPHPVQPETACRL